ncbi:hypothetical protein ACE40V_24285, partial [Salmonella enterica]|uniref:hypothetical protein n=1 Tax=Salmonella enterica TaxID=28901 RepID=UPI003D2DB6C3
LDLPPKIYQRRYFDLSPEQRRVYKSIRDEAFAVLSSGESITMHMALVQRIRLQQVTCGYLPVMVDEETEEMRLTRIDPNNDPRMDET